MIENQLYADLPHHGTLFITLIKWLNLNYYRWKLCQSAQKLNYTWEVRYYGPDEPPARQPAQNDITLRSTGTTYQDFNAPGTLTLDRTINPVSQTKLTVRVNSQ